MALNSGDTLSLNALAAATGQTTKSLSAARGNTDNPIKISDFAIEATYGINGYTYVAENTTEVYTMQRNAENGNVFDSTIGARPENFTWSSSSNITLSSNPNYQVTITLGDKNPQSPGSQTSLESQEAATISMTFADGFNDHATNYNTELSRTIYVVDSYDGNTVDMCLTLDTPIQLADGTYVEAGDLEEGMVLKGTTFDGLEKFTDTDYIKWTTNTLFSNEEDVTVTNLVYGFAEKLYIFNDGLVKSTMEHPFLVKEESGLYKFKRAHLIEASDSFVQLVSGEYIETPIENIEIVEESTEIVTIDVDGSNIYFANNIVSHNKDQGNTHSDFPAPPEVEFFQYSTGTQKLVWGGVSHLLDPDSVSGVHAFEIQWSTNSSFNTVPAPPTKIWNHDPEPSGYNEWSLNVLDLDSSITTSGTYTREYYFRIRVIGNGGQYSGWFTLPRIDDTTGTNLKATITNTVAF